MKKTLDDITEEEYMEMSKKQLTAEARFAAAGHQYPFPSVPGIKKEQVEPLAEEHWEWIKKLLDTHLLVTERLFKDGFEHGWKHARRR